MMLISTVLIAIPFILVAIWLYLRAVCGVCTSKNRMDGKVVIVTGSTGGIGKETTKDLARRGAKIIMPCLYLDEGYRVRDELIQETGNRNILVYELDLTSTESIRKFAQKINETEDRLDVLIHNAGEVDFLYDKKLTKDGRGHTMALNHFGPFLLTHLLIDLLKKSAPSRIVVVASKMYFLGNLDLENHALPKRFPWYNYCASKLSNIVFTEELARRLEGTGVTANSLHPGVIDTGIWDGEMDLPMVRLVTLLRKTYYKTPKEGAQTSIHLAVSEDVNGVTGKHFEECQEMTVFRNTTKNVQRFWELSMKYSQLEPTDPKI